MSTSELFLPDKNIFGSVEGLEPYSDLYRRCFSRLSTLFGSLSVFARARAYI